MLLMRPRVLITLWIGAFAWWCWWGAAVLLRARSFDTPALVVGPMLLPGFLAGMVAALAALRRPTRRAILLLAVLLALQVVLVLLKW